MRRPGSAAEVGKVLFDVRPDKKEQPPAGGVPRAGASRSASAEVEAFHPKMADFIVLG